MGLECWSPRSGCLEEGELRNEDWVRILGPVHFEKSGRSVWWILNHRPTDRENGGTTVGSDFS